MRRCARREIDQIISLNRGRESSFPTPFPLAQTPAHVDHSRRTWYFFNPAAIELLRRFRVLPSSLFPPRAKGATRLFCKHFETTCAHNGDAANRLIMWASERALYFLRCRALKKNCSRGKVSRNFRKLS